MWVEVQRIANLVQDFRDFGNAEAIDALLRDLEKYKWRIQNITRNAAKNAADRAKLKAGTEVTIADTKIVLSEEIANEATIVSDIFNLNEMDALDLILIGESQQANFDNMNRGLMAVACYYDSHRQLAVLLRSLLDLDKEEIPEKLRHFIENHFVQRSVFQHLLQIQATFNVASEFHTLMQPNVNGLGGANHQNLLRSAIEEIREVSCECLYRVCHWGADHAKEFLSDLYPILKALPMAERLSAHHVAAWIAMVKLASSDVLSQTNTASAVISEMIKEIRDETAWSDQSVCGTAQLACAVSIRSMAVSVTDHSNIGDIDVNVDVIFDHAVRNHAFQFIRLCIIGSDHFALCESNAVIVDRLFRQLIGHYPAKLVELEHTSEDELDYVTQMLEKGQTVKPLAHYENFLRCLSDLYFLVDNSSISIRVRDALSFLSMQYGAGGSMDLCRFLERARNPHHHMHTIAYLHLLTALCRNEGTASLIYDIFANSSYSSDECASWSHTMTAFRNYERFFREEPKSGSPFSIPTMQSHAPTAPASVNLPPQEIAGFIAWVNLIAVISNENEEVCDSLLSDRNWALVETVCGCAAAPVPLPLKGALFSLLAILAKRDHAVVSIWNALHHRQICSFADNGALLGLQQELDERECTTKRYDTSIGFARLMRSLLSHKQLPEQGAPYLQFLTKSLISQLTTRSYADVNQMWELGETALWALYELVQRAITDPYALSTKDAHIGVLVQLLNDTPLYRAVCSLLLEDCDAFQDPSAGRRASEKAALAALKLFSTAIIRHATLKSSLRAAASDVLLASLPTLLLGALNRGVCFLDVIFQYLEQADSLPSHALCAAHILRELCAVRPSLQQQMVDSLRSRPLLNTNRRAIKNILSTSTVRYSVEDVILRDVVDEDLLRTRGEGARVVLELLADSIESDPNSPNLCYLLFNFQPPVAGAALLKNEALPSGFHEVIRVVDAFINAEDPFQLPYSALFEPCFRILQRLVSMNSPYSPAVLRLLRGHDTIARLLKSNFLTKSLELMTEEGVDPTIASLSRMILGAVLHLAALEISNLMRTGHFEKPQEFLSTLLKTSRSEDGDETDNLLFTLLVRSHPSLIEEIPYPQLSHFNRVKLQKVFERCRTSTVLNIEQIDVANLHALLVREIEALHSEDAAMAYAEMERVLAYCADSNAQLLQHGSSQLLTSGCTAILNVIALFSPFSFFSFDLQLELLQDATFVIINFASSSAGDSLLAITATLERLCAAVVRTTKKEVDNIVIRRGVYCRILRPLLELIVQPCERPLMSRVHIYHCVQMFLIDCYQPIGSEEGLAKPDDEWYLERTTMEPEEVDPIRHVVTEFAFETSKRLTQDVAYFPTEHKPTALRVLSNLLHEDSLGSRKLSYFVVQDGMPRYLSDSLLHVELDWNNLALAKPADTANYQAFIATCSVLLRLCQSEFGWTALSTLELPEIFAQIPIFKSPPKDLFLNPAVINSLNSAPNLFATALDYVMRISMAMFSKPKAHRHSLKIVDAVYTQSELLSQLLRAELNCRLLDTASQVIKGIYESDETVRKSIDDVPLLKKLRLRAVVKPAKVKPTILEASFNAPSRLLSNSVVSSHV